MALDALDGIPPVSSRILVVSNKATFDGGGSGGGIHIARRRFTGAAHAQTNLQAVG